jgi:NADH:ubiquinone oxidoreductase subunit F (NADH-binding)
MGAAFGHAVIAAAHLGAREGRAALMQSRASLPRLLAGAESGYVELAAHLRVHGSLPPQGGPRRGRPGALADEVERAGLRGRGGAGFPTAVKMHATAAARGRSRTVVVNAVEAEPASMKDCTLLASAPHLVLDGAAAAARAVGAREAIVCGREGTGDALDAVELAISERAGMAGADPEFLLAVAPRDFVAGQESALVAHLNGGPARPTFTPPMIFERGVGGRPTLLSNAETFAHLALIARHGAPWFRELGTAAHPGSALVTLSGAVAAPGVYEIEHGVTARSLIAAAGGAAERVRAVLVGGYAGTWIDGSMLAELTLDDGWLVPHGASTGAGVVVVLGESACPVAEVVRVTAWLAAETAGQCGPCVHGLAAIAETAAALAAGADPDGAHELARLAAVVRGRGACRHPDGALRLLASALQVFAPEFDDHARHGPCDRCAAPPVLPVPAGRARRELAA